MASVFYNEAKRAFAAGEFDWGAHDFRVRLVMTNTTCGTQNDGIIDLADFTLIDIADASGYANVALTSEVVNKSDSNDRAELDAADVSFTGLGGDASRNYKGVLLYKHVDGTNANDLACAFIEFSDVILAASTTVTVPWSSSGILNLS